MSADAVKRRRDWWRLYQDLRERMLKEAAANLLSAMQTPPTAKHIEERRK